ncbi:unnamed protein product, partial [Prorocentrum cordatum]
DAHLHGALKNVREMEAASAVHEQEKSKKAPRQRTRGRRRFDGGQAHKTAKGNKSRKKEKKTSSSAQSAKGRALKLHDPCSSTSSSAATTGSSGSSDGIDLTKIKKE